MKIDITSDWHLNFFEDLGDEFIHTWQAEGEILVLAGDVGDYTWWQGSLQRMRTLCGKYEQVFFVAGNHEYYGASFGEADARLWKLEGLIENFRVLEQETCTLRGVKFAGCSLWFLQNPMGEIYKNWMNDFRLIQDFTPEVYQRNGDSRRFLESLEEVDVVITHHLPTHFSVHERYAKDPLNSFFLCEMDRTIIDLQPKLWVHGHTHIPLDYRLWNTRIICNPMGYPREFGRKVKEHRPITVEV